MIAHFITVDKKDPEGLYPERLQIAFVDSSERAWCVWVQMNPSADDLKRALSGAMLIATDPEQAVRVGLISQHVLDEANLARDQMRLSRARTSGTVM